jgi:hypothetical protein
MGGLFDEKTRGQKTHDSVPLKFLKNTKCENKHKKDHLIHFLNKLLDCNYCQMFYFCKFQCINPNPHFYKAITKLTVLG